MTAVESEDKSYVALIGEEGGEEVASPSPNRCKEFVEAGRNRYYIMLGLVVVIATLAIVVAVVSQTDETNGGGGHISDQSDIGGLWLDSNYWSDDGTMKGTRILSDHSGVTKTSAVTIVGSDDGIIFWTLSGSFLTSSTISIDFSPMGNGEKDVAGTYSMQHNSQAGSLVFDDSMNTTWIQHTDIGVCSN